MSIDVTASWVSRPAGEVHWLSRHDRHLPVPGVCYVTGLSVGGLYVPPWPDSQIVEGIEIPPSNGIIIVGEWGDDLPPETILAHEWRHHWQQWNGWQYDGIGWSSPADYTSAIRDYFTRSISEMDALQYEALRAPTNHTAWLLDLCSSSPQPLNP